MSYATPADLEQRFGADEMAQLADPLHTGSAVPALLELALADADAEINGYLAARYQLPLVTVPPVLVRVACDVARYRLWADRSSDEVRRRYDDAIKLLTHVAKGVVALAVGLGGDADAPEPSLAGFAAGAPRVFGRDKTGGY
jgi:phage gp36-like protein